ncbi:unnamed protein product [Urochloa decumbens]|uniref:Replication factor A C-terminal domain-containing protein n=1 Tax=Urochloa decumbens TaxID=240449 RepID=A0ABC9DWR5_9POAL
MVEYTMLSNLRPKDRQSTICVRIIRKWEFHGKNENDPILHIGLIVADEKRNAMYAEIPAAHIEKHNDKLEENGTYTIKYFKVANLKDSYRPVHAPYMLEFIHWTEIKPAINPPETFPRYVYRLTEFDQLSERIGDHTYFLDILAVITEVAEPVCKYTSTNEVSTITRNVMLQDINGNELKLTLWGRCAQEFSIDNVYNAIDAKPIVTLFVGYLMKSFYNNANSTYEHYLSGSSACKWYFNPEIPEAEAFYAKFQGQRIEIKQPENPTQLSVQPTPAPIVQTKTLQELMSMHPFDFLPNGYQCTVTISRLIPSPFWWYSACKICHTSMSAHGSGYKCHKCNYTGYSYRLKISFIATDGTAEAEMICFGNTASRIVGKSCDYVMRSAGRGHNIPSPIAAIVSEKFTFAIKLTDNSYDYENRSFIVNSVITSHGKQRTIPQIKTITGTSTQGSTTGLLPQHQSTSPPVPAISASPRTPHIIQSEATDTPPFDPDTPDDLSARKRLFLSNIDNKQETGEDSVKKTKLDQSISGVKEDCLNPTSPERSSPANQINHPTQQHHSTKKLQHQKKKIGQALNQTCYLLLLTSFAPKKQSLQKLSNLLSCTYMLIYHALDINFVCFKGSPNQMTVFCTPHCQGMP